MPFEERPKPKAARKPVKVEHFYKKPCGARKAGAHSRKELAAFMKALGLPMTIKGVSSTGKPKHASKSTRVLCNELQGAIPAPADFAGFKRARKPARKARKAPKRSAVNAFYSPMA